METGLAHTSHAQADARLVQLLSESKQLQGSVTGPSAGLGWEFKI